MRIDYSLGVPTHRSAHLAATGSYAVGVISLEGSAAQEIYVKDAPLGLTGN
jgi:hypothetical protein